MALLSRRDPARNDERRSRREALQGRVMAATEDLLREGTGFAELPIETIAARVGISRTTFYDYFGDKRELLLRLSGALLDDWIAEADEWRPGGDHDATRADLRRIIGAMVEVQKHPVMIAVVEATFYDLEIRAAWVAHQEAEIARAVRLLEAERAAGRFRAHASELEPRARALHWCIQQTVLQEIVLRPNVEEPKMIDAIADVMIVGVRGELH
jgi:AcrR family transcriptional regulator